MVLVVEWVVDIVNIYDFMVFYRGGLDGICGIKWRMGRGGGVIGKYWGFERWYVVVVMGFWNVDFDVYIFGKVGKIYLLYNYFGDLRFRNEKVILRKIWKFSSVNVSSWVCFVG